MPSFLVYLLLPVPVALMAAGLALEGRHGLPRLRRRRTRTAVPGGSRRDFFGDGVGTEVVATPVAPKREAPAAPARDVPAAPAAVPEPVMGPRAVPDPARRGAERAA
jgi:hypothetical protein